MFHIFNEVRFLNLFVETAAIDLLILTHFCFFFNFVPMSGWLADNPVTFVSNFD